MKREFLIKLSSNNYFIVKGHAAGEKIFPREVSDQGMVLTVDPVTKTTETGEGHRPPVDCQIGRNFIKPSHSLPTLLLPIPTVRFFERP